MTLTYNLGERGIIMPDITLTEEELRALKKIIDEEVKLLDEEIKQQ